MIYTVTLNPSVDYHIWLSSFSEGETHVVEREAKMAGGKGINVSIVLKQLGMESKALGFLGGFTGEFIRMELNAKGVSHDFIPVAGDTRINMKLKTAHETECNGISPQIPEEAAAKLLKQLQALTAEDSLVLAGSMPSSLPQYFYRQIIEQAAAKGVTVFLDSKGEALHQAIPARPFLIKPNHHELGDLFCVQIETPDEAIPYAKKLVEQGAQNVIVSLAGRGAIFTDGHVTYVAQVPKGEVVNSVGAGDSTVAGFLYQWQKTGDKLQAFRYGLASGSATAFHEGFCTPESIEELLPQVQITQK
ncbi:1-phosphofructokinase [Brevibacillus dissolubilis]|uniref:1-phosphofructokinase n=1 Tax=Brevibacillus dissolubilis TaxID=1844116 RepID=UPI0011178529|nr:1-phosphofructokinase [Brevibacillus dissolubilis]